MMSEALSARAWERGDRFFELQSPWLTLIGEHWRDDRQQHLEYWRVEKADSAIVLPLCQDQLLLPSPSYRPGLGESTLDFPGGRVPIGQSPAAVIPTLLQRELQIPPDSIQQLDPLNTTGWAVNSSFSNQRLYGFVAQLDATILTSDVAPQWLRYPTTPAGIHDLLAVLTCLQCRALLLEWWLVYLPREGMAVFPVGEG